MQVTVPPFLLPLGNFFLLRDTLTDAKSSADTRDDSGLPLLLPECDETRAELVDSPAAEEASLRAEGGLEKVCLLPGAFTTTGSLYLPCPEP